MPNIYHSEKIYNDIVRLLKVQGEDGNWNANAYMWGMYNGLALALSCCIGGKPPYKDKPRRFLDDKPELDRMLNVD